MLNKKKMDNYQEIAQKFLNDTYTEIAIKWVDNNTHSEKDKEKRDIYYITLKKQTRMGYESYGFTFGQSLAHSSENPFGKKRPTAYDILACLTAEDPETFEDFCGCYGYDTDSISALNTYNKVCAEYKSLRRLYSATELQMLSEII